MPIIIRDACQDDLASIVDFNARLAAESEDRILDPQRLAKGVDAVLQDPAKGRYFLATDGGDRAGQLMLTTEWSDWRNGAFWWIQSVYVEPRYRRHGVFRALFDHAAALARARPDVCGLRLYFEDNNLSAREVYLRVGLTMAGYHIMEVDFLRPD